MITFQKENGNTQDKKSIGLGSGKGNPEQRSEMGESHFPERVALWQVIREGNKVEWWAELTTQGLPK